LNPASARAHLLRHPELGLEHLVRQRNVHPRLRDRHSELLLEREASPYAHELSDHQMGVLFQRQHPRQASGIDELGQEPAGFLVL